jgi:hypothetical protein
MSLEKLRGGGVRHNVKNAEILHRALKDAGIDFVSLVPDSYFRELNRLLLEDREIRSVTATREDEGMAICAGAYLEERDLAWSWRLRDMAAEPACSPAFVRSIIHPF